VVSGEPADPKAADYKQELTAAQERAKFAKAQLAAAAKAEKEFAKPAGRPRADLYSRQAFMLISNQGPCQACHDVGPLRSDKPRGPNLVLSADRLRPDWLEKWLAHPARLFPYNTIMPQNFPNKEKSIEYQFQQLFVGKPIDQVRGIRDILMDKPRLEDLIPTQPPKAPAGGKQK